jgi:hypothetical protein
VGLQQIYVDHAKVLLLVKTSVSNKQSCRCGFISTAPPVLMKHLLELAG